VIAFRILAALLVWVIALRTAYVTLTERITR